jgi:hypothetical protein
LELRQQDGQTVASVSPNWFGVAVPNPANFDLSSDVYVVRYFHPEPAQAGFNDADYFNKNGANGTDWKQLYAFADRLGGQMAGSTEHYNAPTNRLIIFPFLEQPASAPAAPYTLATSESGDIIHDILQDINNNLVNGTCRPLRLPTPMHNGGGVDADRSAR